MIPPWHELKQSEIVAMKLRNNDALNEVAITAVRRLFERCKDAPDADEAICYHGVRSLIAEFDGEFDVAIEHRRIEIQKIYQLHELARQNEGDRPALKSYGEQELEHRNMILDELLARNAG